MLGDYLVGWLVLMMADMLVVMTVANLGEHLVEMLAEQMALMKVV